MDLFIQIVRFLGLEPQPGLVECQFVDSDQRTHTLIDKTPIFSCDDLDEQSPYPVPGRVRCEVLTEWKDNTSRELVRIKTAESTDGLSEFVVLKEQLTS